MKTKLIKVAAVLLICYLIKTGFEQAEGDDVWNYVAAIGILLGIVLI